MLKYVGGSFIVGIPARDLTDADIEALEHGIWRKLKASHLGLKGSSLQKFLVNSGCYVEVRSKKKLDGPSEDK